MNVNSTRPWSVLAAAGAALLMGGCASLIAPMIVAPQRGGLEGSLERSSSGRFFLQDLEAYVSVRRRFPVGPPPAELAVAVIPPGRYSLGFGVPPRAGCTSLQFTGSRETRLFRARMRLWLSEHHMTEAQAKRKSVRSITLAPVPPAVLRGYRAAIAGLRSTARPRGTVILLPGYGLGKLSMLPWALLLGRAGYQSILVDSRAQGQSTGRHVTYGALESTDLVRLAAALREAGLIQGRLGMLGDSMGAATALLAAPHIPDLAAVVAISPYGRATTVIPRYARLAHWYARLVPSRSWRAAERKAGRVAGARLAEAAPIDAVAKIRAPVLYVQGGRDEIISPSEARRLAARTPDAHLLIYPEAGHLQVSEDYAQLAQPVIGWYNRYLAGNLREARRPASGPLPPHAVALNLCVGW
jgi:pimeloyl-ACP methyl ester carboxylesterase